MDLTPVWRDKNAGSSMGSNFGSVPYNNTANGNLSEFHFSHQNSRLGFRIDGDWKGAHFIGYNEFDFNGTSGSTSLAVSNGAIVPRLRLFWVDVRKGKIEFLAGQSWSMLTPNRNGISALPGDLFYTQVIDINYMAGLTWTRQPGMRVLFHPNNKVTFGFSAEQPDQYIGGSAGGSRHHCCLRLCARARLGDRQLDSWRRRTSAARASYLAQPAVTPDFIAKLAFDPTRASTSKSAASRATSRPPTSRRRSRQHLHHQRAAAFWSAQRRSLKNFRLISTNFLSDGDGRYLFGQAPDLIVRADGSLSPVHAGGTIDGFEATVKNTLLYGYYGGIYIGRNAAIDANGKPDRLWLHRVRQQPEPRDQRNHVRVQPDHLEESALRRDQRDGAVRIAEARSLVRRRRAPQGDARQHHLLQRSVHAAGRHAELLGAAQWQGCPCALNSL